MALTCALTIRVVQADDTLPTGEVRVLPQVDVNETSAPTSLTSPDPAEAAAEKTQVPGGFTVITPEEMNLGRSSNFQDLLRQAPGLVLQSQNDAEVSKIYVRGSASIESDETIGVNVLLDGLPFTEADGETDLENFDVGSIKAAQLYRGADALKFGSVMLGGAINLIPYTGYDSDPFAVQMETGSYGYWHGRISGGGVSGPVDYYGSVMGRYMDGYREHSREHTDLLFSDVGYKISETAEDRLYLTFAQTDRQVPGGLTKEQMEHDPRADGEDAVEQNLSRKWNFFRLGDKLTIKRDDSEFNVGGFWYHVDETSRDLYTEDNFDGIQLYHSNNFGLLVNYTLKGELVGHRNILTAGFCPEYEDEHPHNYQNIDGHTGATTADGVGQHLNIPFYAENQFYLTQPLSLFTGFQFVYVRRNYKDLFLEDGDSSHLQNFYGLNPKVGLLYEIDLRSQAFINFSRSWQPPSLDNALRFTDDGVSVYQPLQPQSAWTIETGVRGKADRFDWDLALYHAWIRNEILELFNSSDSKIGAFNVPHSYHQGVEAGLAIELLDLPAARPSGYHLTFHQTYTLTDAHFDNDPTYGNNRIAGLPVNFYKADLLFQSPIGFYAGPNVQWNLSHYPVDQANTLYVDPYALLGFKVGWKWKKWQVFVEGKNLTDKRYPASVDAIADARKEPDPDSFYPGNGRAFYGGISVAL